jgi:hypothetical protein
MSTLTEIFRHCLTMPEICSIFLHTLPEIFIRDGIAAGNEAGRD